MIPVVWWSANPDAPCTGYWDQTLLRDLLDTLPRHRAVHVEARPQQLNAERAGGAVVVVGGAANRAHVAELNADLAELAWVLLIVTSDEERRFPIDQVTHPRMLVWRQYGRADDPEEHRQLPIGYAAGTREHLPRFDLVRGPWAFLGQLTHGRRYELVKALREDGRGHLVTSEGFAQGVNQDAYLAAMAGAKLAPCPAGAVHPDSFRFYEALEAGCVPVLDLLTSDGQDWGAWWSRMLGPSHPFVLVGDWVEAWPLVTDQELREWPLGANLAGAWWEQTKLRLRRQLADDVEALGAEPEPTLGDQLTVLVSMSPIPSHPHLDVLEETLASIRAQLPDSLVIITCDGVRGEQIERWQAYQEAVRQVVARCRRGDWGNAVPVVSPDHQHQANMARRALRHVTSRALVFVEHDTPLTGTIPWAELVEAVTGGDAHVVRLHYDVDVHPDHRHLMLDRDERTGQPLVQQLGAIPAMRTFQWSQRPHVARTDWYRMALRDHFPPTGRTMIEDKLHGVVQELPWDWARLWLYAPEGNMQRSTHLDGRGADPKFDMRYE